MTERVRQLGQLAEVEPVVPERHPSATRGPTTRTFAPQAVSVPQARRFVAERLAGRGDPDLVDTALLCTSELVTNAVLHARTEVQVRVEDLGPVVRLEVRDRSAAVPRRLLHTVRSATGRGMEMVSLLSSSWGVDLLEDRTKSVWCEISTVSSPPPDVDDLLAAWPDDGDAPAEVWIDASQPLVSGRAPAAPAVPPAPPADPSTPSVVLVGYPVRLGLRAREHTMALLRECALLSHAPAGTSAPARLVQLAESMTAHHGGELAEVEQQRAEALARGADTVDLRYPARPESRPLIEGWRAVMVELDAYAAGTALLTQATPPDLASLRDWTTSQLLTQLDGGAAEPWTGPLD